MEIYKQTSLDKFKQVTNIHEFMQLWAEFYKDKLIIPSYGDFFSKGDHRNPDTQTIEYLYSLTKSDLCLFVDSQGCQNTTLKQRPYYVFYCPQKIANYLEVHLNLCENIVCYIHNENNARIRIPVTFEDGVVYTYLDNCGENIELICYDLEDDAYIKISNEIKSWKLVKVFQTSFEKDTILEEIYKIISLFMIHK